MRRKSDLRRWLRIWAEGGKAMPFERAPRAAKAVHRRTRSSDGAADDQCARYRRIRGVWLTVEYLVHERGLLGPPIWYWCPRCFQRSG